MTIPVEQTRYVYIGPFSAGGTIPIPFSYDEPEHVKMLSGNNTLEINVDYTVLGKNITMLTPVATGVRVVVFRDTPINNEAEFPQEAKFDSEKINDAIDKLTMQNQEQEDGILRAVKFPMGTDASVLDGVTFPLPSPGKGIKWDDDGNLANTDTSIDEIIEKATEQADKAEAQATIATTQAGIATAAAEDAKKTLLDVHDAVADAKKTLLDVHDAVADGLESIDDKTTESITAIETATTAAKNEAVSDVEAAGVEAIATAKSWAIDPIESRPEGSAKYWADVAKETAQFDTYTKSEIDGKLAGKEPAITGSTGLTNVRVVNDDGSITNEYNVNKAYLDQFYDAKGTAASIGATKQDTLTAGTGITISEDNVISSTGGGGSVENAVTLDTDQTITGKKKISNDGYHDMLSFECTNTLTNPVGYIGMGANNDGGLLRFGVDYNSTYGGNELRIGSNISSGAEVVKRGIRFSSNIGGAPDCHLVMGNVNYASSIAFLNTTGHIVLYPLDGGQLDIGNNSLIYTDKNNTSKNLLEQAETTPIATTATAGKVKPDGDTISVAADGKIGVIYNTYTETEWSNLTEAQKSAIKLALVLE